MAKAIQEGPKFGPSCIAFAIRVAMQRGQLLDPSGLPSPLSLCSPRGCLLFSIVFSCVLPMDFSCFPLFSYVFPMDFSCFLMPFPISSPWFSLAFICFSLSTSAFGEFFFQAGRPAELITIGRPHTIARANHNDYSFSD